MGKIKDIQRFAGVEWLLQDYFNFHLAPVMEDVRKELGRRQAEEMRDYSCSAAGILSFMASSQMPGSDPYQLLKVTGEWNSKTTEDYVEMCRQRILAPGNSNRICPCSPGNGVMPSWRKSDGNSTTSARHVSAATWPMPTWATGWNNG